MSLLALCIFPFIPKMSKKNLAIKKAQAKSLFAQDFQHRMCELKEKAIQEGLEWIETAKKKKTVLTVKEKIFFKDFLIKANVQGRMYLLKTYDTKNNKNKLYRFKIELNYRVENTQKKEPFYFYITLMR